MKSARPSIESATSEFERDYVRPRPGRALIVGSRVYRDKEDRRARYADVLGVDMQAGEGVDQVLDMEEDLPQDLGLFDHVECMSVLEHSRRPWLIAANIERLMVPGATLYVTVPFCWRIHGYPSDYWRMTPDALRVLFPGLYWSALKLTSDGIYDEPKIRTLKVNGYPYFIRTETVGFGFKP